MAISHHTKARNQVGMVTAREERGEGKEKGREESGLQRECLGTCMSNCVPESHEKQVAITVLQSCTLWMGGD